MFINLTGASHQQFIKRPLNAYMIWTRQERRKILSGEPKKKMNEVSKAVLFFYFMFLCINILKFRWAKNGKK